jgi:hypothetical protein
MKCLLVFGRFTWRHGDMVQCRENRYRDRRRFRHLYRVLGHWRRIRYCDVPFSFSEVNEGRVVNNRWWCDKRGYRRWGRWDRKLREHWVLHGQFREHWKLDEVVHIDRWGDLFFLFLVHRLIV